MTTYEYMYLELVTTPAPRMVVQLNDAGAEGWHVVSYEHEGGFRRILLEREKPPERRHK